MMKKLWALLLALTLTAALAGCDSIPGQSGGDSAGGDGYPDEEGYASGRLGDTMHTYFFDFTVNSAAVCDAFGDYVPAEGSELLVVELTVKNTMTQSVPMYDGDFQAQWNEEDEEAYAWPIPFDGEDPAALSGDQLPGEYTLAVDESRTGLLVFEVPAGFEDFSISTVEYFDDGSEEGEMGDTFFVYFTAERDGAAA